MFLLQGLSRYDAISKITKSMHYDNLGKCGHLVFLGQPLQQAAQVLQYFLDVDTFNAGNLYCADNTVGTDHCSLTARVLRLQTI